MASESQGYGIKELELSGNKPARARKPRCRQNARPVVMVERFHRGATNYTCVIQRDFIMWCYLFEIDVFQYRADSWSQTVRITLKRKHFSLHMSRVCLCRCQLMEYS
jgi:hypothetical protein